MVGTVASAIVKICVSVTCSYPSTELVGDGSTFLSFKTRDRLRLGRREGPNSNYFGDCWIPKEAGLRSEGIFRPMTIVRAAQGFNSFDPAVRGCAHSGGMTCPVISGNVSISGSRTFMISDAKRVSRGPFSAMLTMTLAPPNCPAHDSLPMTQPDASIRAAVSAPTSCLVSLMDSSDSVLLYGFPTPIPYTSTLIPANTASLDVIRSSCSWLKSRGPRILMSLDSRVESFVSASRAMWRASARSASDIRCSSPADWAICEENLYSPTMPATTIAAKRIFASLYHRRFSRNGRIAYSPRIPTASTRVERPDHMFAQLIAASNSSLVINPRYAQLWR